jgi:hypothetical protein
MNLDLHIIEKSDLKKHSNGCNFGFAVTDLNKSKKYPANLLCILTLSVNPKSSHPSVFSKLFGKDSKKIA